MTSLNSTIRLVGAEDELKVHAAESTHWYDQNGEPRYTVPYADPKKGFRNTTLRDAKKMGLVPSVTTILGVANKPALNRWKENQILLAAMTLHRS